MEISLDVGEHADDSEVSVTMALLDAACAVDERVALPEEFALAHGNTLDADILVVSESAQNLKEFPERST